MWLKNNGVGLLAGWLRVHEEFTQMKKDEETFDLYAIKVVGGSLCVVKFPWKIFIRTLS